MSENKSEYWLEAGGNLVGLREENSTDPLQKVLIAYEDDVVHAYLRWRVLFMVIELRNKGFSVRYGDNLNQVKDYEQLRLQQTVAVELAKAKVAVTLTRE